MASTRNRRLSVIPDEHGKLRSPTSRMSIRSLGSNSATPKASSYPRPASSMSTHSRKRGGTVADTYMRRHQVPQPHFGGHRYKGAYKGAPIATDLEPDYDMASHLDDDDPDASFEGLDNVRACCDGKHLVGHGHHHGHSSNSNQGSSVPPTPTTPMRAQTPSIRSRASSILSTVRR
jgi:hypothetical protein